jgi:hypothetical protein
MEKKVAEAPKAPEPSEGPKIYKPPTSEGHANQLITETKAKILSLEEKLAGNLASNSNLIVKEGEPEQKIRGELRVARENLAHLERHRGILAAATAPATAAPLPDPIKW